MPVSNCIKIYFFSTKFQVANVPSMTSLKYQSSERIIAPKDAAFSC